MIKLFNKDNFIPSTFDKHQRKQSLFVSILSIIFFIFSGFTFFNSIYSISNALGALVCSSPDVMVKELLRSLPIFLSAVMSIWAMLLLHASFRNVNEEKRLHSYKKNAITLTVISSFNILYIFIMRFIGRYVSLFEGSPSPIYPFDAILYSILFLVIGIFTLVYLAKLKDKLPYLVPSRGPIVSKCRPLYCIGMFIFIVVSIYSFAAFSIGLFIIDFIHGHQFYSIMLLIAFFIAFIFMMVYEFYYNELKVEKRKELLLPLGIIGLIISIIVVTLYFIALSLDRDAPSNIGFGVLPISFAASINIGSFFILFTPLGVAITAFIKGLLFKLKNK